MEIVASFRASELSRDQLRAVMPAYWALDRARNVRRRLVRRFGLLALAAAVAGAAVHRFPLFARCTIGLLLVPPLWAWMNELRFEGRLAQRLDGVHADKVVSLAPARGPAHKKVVKSP